MPLASRRPERNQCSLAFRRRSRAARGRQTGTLRRSSACQSRRRGVTRFDALTKRTTAWSAEKSRATGSWRPHPPEHESVQSDADEACLGLADNQVLTSPCSTLDHAPRNHKLRAYKDDSPARSRHNPVKAIVGVAASQSPEDVAVISGAGLRNTIPTQQGCARSQSARRVRPRTGRRTRPAGSR